MIVTTTEGIDELRELLKNANLKVVFTNGVFDILHAGHVTYLEQAANEGDVLVVGLNSDESVRRLKGASRPVNAQEDRATVLQALRCVNHVVVFSADTPLDLIVALQPDVLVKGADYKKEDVVGAKEVEARGGSVVLMPLLEGRSTTNIITRAQKV
ncbi:MAG: D-glycero-beta-D-manno-heptose 1-phosphate adenylyltransferase [Ignavibacteria bacterium]|nr:D-glycero-beta-D-manno-heptose 1-phosphate adenylyltransferase [Ignavibacteria bacterium]